MTVRTAFRFLAALAFSTLAVSVSAQVTTGTLAGSVRDAQGSAVPGATVSIVSVSRNVTTETVTNSTGDFVFPNITPDTFTLRVKMDGFKTLERADVAVSPGDRVTVGNLMIEVGALSETVIVSGEAPMIQAQSGERSFTVATQSVQNLPIASRSFTELAALAPGVTLDTNNTPTRLGGGGSTNIMMDGVSTMDTGSNRPLLQMNTESIAEVKILTSGYQAEYGRASGVQVSAVTKSGSNQFRGSLYDVQRNSKWNNNSKVNKLNGDPKAVLREKDLGYSIGGPIGKPGHNNKLFFFYAQEFSPRTGGGNVVRYRMPTALERAGDFSQSLDNNGALYPYIKDPLITGVCTAADTTACFNDGGVLGKIPSNRLYQTGLSILKLYPLPNIQNVPANQNYNYEATRPNESVLSWQPAVRVDYQPTDKFRITGKYSAWSQAQHTFNGTIPGFNDTYMQNAPVTSYTVSANYTLTRSIFLEGTYGRSENQLAGCAQAQSSTGAIFCNNSAGSQGVPATSFSSLAGAGLSQLPFLYPNATVLNPDYYAVKALNELQPAFWDGSRISKIPSFTWGGRVPNNGGNCTSACAPPNLAFPGWLNISNTNDVSFSLTSLMGRHTVKTGFYNTHSFKAEQTSNNAFGTINFQQDNVGTNQFDTSFGFSNAAIGTFSSYQQATKYAETASLYNNTEGYIQDNWKVNGKLTLDYGMRIVHQQPQYDRLGQASNFVPEKWSASAAPVLFTGGCANGVYPCTGTNRQAMNPVTGQFLGPNSTSAIGTLVPNSGNVLNGLFLPGQEGVPASTYFAPTIGFGPRFGAAYDLSGSQSMVLRGGVGVFFDRPSSTTFSGGVNNPPTSGTVTVQYSQLQTLGSAGLTTAGAPNLSAIKLHTGLPTSIEGNVGMQIALPWASSLDVSYVGQHSYNQFQGVNINAVDFGTAFLPQYQDPSTATSTTPGAAAVVTSLLKPLRGYGNITQQWDRGYRTYHSIQLSLQRRFRNGVSFGFNDTLALSDTQQSGARLQHNADGSYALRADQAEADALMGNNNPSLHNIRANFIWDLPDVSSNNMALNVLSMVVNDWQLSGVWQGSRTTPGNQTSAYTVSASYQNGGGNVNLTGSPDYGGRIRVVGDTGKGCSSNPYQQFNVAAFQGPTPGSVGLESGNNYLHQCFYSVFDTAIARNIRLPHARTIQLRLDIFNAFNQATITGRNTTINLSSPTDPVTGSNLPYDAAGNLVVSRSLPRGAGFGVANAYQNPRTMQGQIRFSF